jgi:hypothetical protein
MWRNVGKGYAVPGLMFYGCTGLLVSLLVVANAVSIKVCCSDEVK